MDYTALLVKMLPASVLPYLKFVVTVLGGAASAALAAYSGLNVDPRWVVLSAALTALGTYLTPNVGGVKLLPLVAEQATGQDGEYADGPEPVAEVNPGVPGALDAGAPEKVEAADPAVPAKPAAPSAAHEIGV